MQLKGEWSSHSAKLSSEHSAELTAERERTLHSQTEAQTRHEREKRELEQSHAAKVEFMHVCAHNHSIHLYNVHVQCTLYVTIKPVEPSATVYSCFKLVGYLQHKRSLDVCTTCVHVHCWTGMYEWMCVCIPLVPRWWA